MMDSKQVTQQAQHHREPHVLFELTPLELRVEIDDKTQRFYQSLKQMIAGKTPKECHELYFKHIAANPQQNTEELTIGLLVAILVEQEGQQSKYYRDVVTFSKDGLNLFSTNLNIIIIDRLHKSRDHSIKQIFWITHQLMKANINTAENICSNLVRQLAGGDVSVRNLWLIENVLELLSENRAWLINSTTFMIPTVIYTFLRLISDHMGSSHATLRQKEVDFVIGLIREKFLDCMSIGRDFLRLLHSVIRIPEFDKLWHEIYNNPKSLHPSFQNPLQLLTFRTPRRLFQSRLTFEMEKKITFLATQVKFGNQKRYQDWFHKQYLATPESLSLRCDLIRYICTIIHPSNEVLCSDIIPRWAIIGWLLTTCTTNASAATSKLALFFDWLVYDAKVDNIMNIEPAILVMYYSMRSHPNVTASLLDYLCRMPNEFSPKLSEYIKSGIKKSLQQILEKRVLQSLAPLFDNPKHDPTLKALIRETFLEFCTPPSHTIDNGISHQNSTSTPAVGATISSSAQQPNTAPGNHITHNAPNKQPELIIIDQDKTNQTATETSAATTTLEATSAATATNKVIASSSEANNTNISKSSTDQNPVMPVAEDKIDQTSGWGLSCTTPFSTNSSSSATTVTTSSSSPTTSRDEIKAFTWNGTENSNPSYSHKQNHDNKNRKSSMSYSSPAGATVAEQANNNKKTANKGSAPIQAPVMSNNFNNDYTNNYNTASNFIDHTADIVKLDNSSSTVRVIYPFMTVTGLDLKETLSSLEEPIRSVIEDMSVERCMTETRRFKMDKLISLIYDNSEQTSTNVNMLDEIGHCVAFYLSEDFDRRIFPSSSQDNDLLESSISTPFFVLCRSAFSNKRPNLNQCPMSLLVAVAKHFQAAGFLILYFLRVSSIINGTMSVCNEYTEFCNYAMRKLSSSLQDDLHNALTYDSEMFCFLLPSVFVEFANSTSYSVTGNINLIKMVVSSIDPIHLQELMCLCLTGTAKVINKEEVLSLIETSLKWESWEQYCLWKLISAQNVHVEKYLSILPKLDSIAHAEAMSSIMLNLQKVTSPTHPILKHIFECDYKPNDPYISSILRYWSMKTDPSDLAAEIAHLVSTMSSSSPVAKRKGQTKSAPKQAPGLNAKQVKILQHLDSIRQKAPKNKLLAQADLLEMMTELEALCDEAQKKTFASLFSNRPRPSKKQKKDS